MSVLVAIDFSENSRRALRTAARRARQRRDSLRIVHFLEEETAELSQRQLSEPPQNLRARLWKRAKSQLEETFQEVVPDDERPGDVDYRVEVDYAEDGIVEEAGESDCELVVLGATGQSRLTSFLLGSTAEQVIRRVDVPVLVVHNEAEAETFERIVAPVDFTECSRHSLEQARDVAREDDAELVLLHAYMLPVTESTFTPAQLPPEAIETYEKQREERLDELTDAIDLEGVTWRRRLDVGSPHNAIVDAVEDEEADLVAMGTHGRRGFERFFLGSTATKVLRQMPCSVMTVRTREEDETDGTES